jgi:hypothetical protein
MAWPPMAHALVELVAHEQHRHALRAQRLDHVHEVVDFLLRERGGGLVHDDHAARVATARAMATSCRVAIGSSSTRRARNAASVGSFTVSSARTAVAATALRSKRRASLPPVRDQLLAERDVFGHAHVRQQRQVLVDRLDAERERLQRRQRACSCAVDHDAPLARGLRARDDLDERALAAAVLAEQVVDLAGARWSGRCRAAHARPRSACARPALRGRHGARPGSKCRALAWRRERCVRGRGMSQRSRIPEAQKAYFL